MNRKCQEIHIHSLDGRQNARAGSHLLHGIDPLISIQHLALQLQQDLQDHIIQYSTGNSHPQITPYIFRLFFPAFFLHKIEQELIYTQQDRKRQVRLIDSHAECQTHCTGQIASGIFRRKQNRQHCQEQRHHVTIHGKHIGKSRCQRRKRYQQTAHHSNGHRVRQFQHFRKYRRRKCQPYQSDQSDHPWYGKIRRKSTGNS